MVNSSVVTMARKAPPGLRPVPSALLSNALLLTHSSLSIPLPQGLCTVLLFPLPRTLLLRHPQIRGSLFPAAMPPLPLILPSFNFTSSTGHLLRCYIVHSFIYFLHYMLHRTQVLSSVLPGASVDPRIQTQALGSCSVNMCGINEVNK